MRQVLLSWQPRSLGPREAADPNAAFLPGAGAEGGPKAGGVPSGEEFQEGVGRGVFQEGVRPRPPSHPWGPQAATALPLGLGVQLRSAGAGAVTLPQKIRATKRGPQGRTRPLWAITSDPRTSRAQSGSYTG